jgi:hypothetical protein
MPAPKCVKSYVQIKDGCTLLRRAVYEIEDSKKKYVKLDGKRVFLSEIRGKYRFSNK